VRKIALAHSFILFACAPGALELSVDVRTDLAAGEDFENVRVELSHSDGTPFAPVAMDAAPALPWASGVRVADFDGVPPGSYRARALLLGSLGEEVLARAIDVTVARDYALTIALTSDCAGVECPGTTEPASFTECVSGACVDPRCGGPTPENCGPIACTSHRDCEGVLECAAACIEGACVCASEPPDGGRGCECTAGESGDEERPCGACGEGVERRPRTCNESCQWEPTGDWGGCETGAECAPGATDSEQENCGNCNLGTRMRSRSCDEDTCLWATFGAWSECVGGGGCAPGDTLGGCDPCGHQVCQGNCTWGGCTPRPGNECLRIPPDGGPVGSNYRCCGSGSRWQFCLPSCDWSTACEACSGCGCG
jgi:hypothetical protein